jgi:hypothetical protein
MVLKNIRYLTLRAAAGFAMVPPLYFFGDMLVTSMGISMPADWFIQAVSIVFGMALALWFVMSRAADPCHSWRLWLIAVSAWVVAIGGYLVWAILFIDSGLSFGGSSTSLNLVKSVLALILLGQFMLLLAASSISILVWLWLRHNLRNCLRTKPSA